jgi:hypothetical protein
MSTMYHAAVLQQYETRTEPFPNERRPWGTPWVDGFLRQSGKLRDAFGSREERLPLVAHVVHLLTGTLHAGARSILSAS